MDPLVDRFGRLARRDRAEATGVLKQLVPRTRTRGVELRTLLYEGSHRHGDLLARS